MKRIFFSLVASLMFCQFNAQDIIYKNYGTEIQSIVIEITTDVIKYKNFNQAEGPIRNVFISDVFMIIYKDGTKEIFKGKNDEAKPPYNHLKNLEQKKIEQESSITNFQQESSNSFYNDTKFKSSRKEKEGALFLKGGFSPIMGFVGFEYFNRKLAIQAGWASLIAPLSKETRTTIGIGASLYLFNWNKCTPYISYGFSSQGAVYEEGPTIHGTYINDWVNLHSVFLGYKVIIGKFVDLKFGTGYSWSEYTNQFSLEAIVGIKIFSHFVKN